MPGSLQSSLPEPQSQLADWASAAAAHFNLAGQALCDKEPKRADCSIMSHSAIPVSDNEKKRGEGGLQITVRICEYREINWIMRQCLCIASRWT